MSPEGIESCVRAGSVDDHRHQLPLGKSGIHWPAVAQSRDSARGAFPCRCGDHQP
jgi:hypothetical protein